MKKNFTKGEWHRDDKLIFAGDYFQTHIADVKDTYNDETATANAKLMVAAPDLLRALEDCVLSLKYTVDGTLSLNMEFQELAYEQGLLAIKKALQ